MGLGPFDLTGGPFLTLYISLLFVAIVAGFAFPRRMRPSGRPRVVTQADELAYLAGGRVRFAESVTARMLAARALIVESKAKFAPAIADEAVSPAERTVVALHPPFRWGRIERALRPHAEALRQRLIGLGLLMTDEERSTIRFWSIVPYLALLAFGAIKWIVGDLRDRPTGYLTLLLIATLVFAAVRWFTIDPRTRAGQDAYWDVKQRSRRLRGAPTIEEVGIAVAIYGTGVLVGSSWADFHRLRQGNDSGASGSADGGCGGGGCGGCGG